MIELSRLQFDPDNPRFPSSVDGQDRQEVLKFMLKDAGLIELMRSIASQGFFPGEPILVSPAAVNSEQEWVVVEGNRRLAACLLLADPELAPINSSAVARAADISVDPTNRALQIPALQFETRGQILKHLGYRHVTGIKEWDPLAKARFLRQRFDDSTATDMRAKLQEVARTIGSRSDYVGRLLTAAGIFDRIESEQYFSLVGVNEKSISFSLISSALAYNDIVTYLGLESSQDIDMPELDMGRLRFLTQIMFEKNEDRVTRLKESRNIGKLAEILSHDNARARLEEGQSLDYCWRLTRGEPLMFRSLLRGAIEDSRTALDKVSELHPDGVDLELTVELKQVAADLNSSVEASVQKD